MIRFAIAGFCTVTLWPVMLVTQHKIYVVIYFTYFLEIKFNIAFIEVNINYSYQNKIR